MQKEGGFSEGLQGGYRKLAEEKKNEGSNSWFIWRASGARPVRNPLHFAVESHFQVRLLWTLHYLQPVYFSTLSFVDSQRTFVAWE